MIRLFNSKQEITYELKRRATVAGYFVLSDGFSHVELGGTRSLADIPGYPENAVGFKIRLVSEPTTQTAANTARVEREVLATKTLREPIEAPPMNTLIPLALKPGDPITTTELSRKLRLCGYRYYEGEIEDTEVVADEDSPTGYSLTITFSQNSVFYTGSFKIPVKMLTE